MTEEPQHLQQLRIKYQCYKIDIDWYLCKMWP